MLKKKIPILMHREPPSQGTMGGPNRPGQRAQDLQGRLRPPISASVCVSLGLKNPGDFTVAEGHEYLCFYLVAVMCMCVRLPSYPSSKHVRTVAC